MVSCRTTGPTFRVRRRIESMWPVIISTTLEDAALRLTNFDLDQAGLRALLDQHYPGKTDAILALYSDASAHKTPFLVQAQILTDAGARKNAITQAEHKAASGPAPVYMYRWDWATPAYDGKFGAVHGHDVDASFHIALVDLRSRPRRWPEDARTAWPAPGWRSRLREIPAMRESCTGRPMT